MAIDASTNAPADEKLLLGLLNSTPLIDGLARDELANPDAARRWLGAHGGPDTAEELSVLLGLRPVLQDVVRGTRSPRELAPFLDGVSQRARATDDGVTWTLDAPSGHAAAARAVLAWDELRRSSPGRLRPCANDECRLFLIDRSKPNSARWCSMATCGNRMKARRHYQKAREVQVSE
jgi:predicted RNA-binding Zn ribbon-like protein